MHNAVPLQCLTLSCLCPTQLTRSACTLASTTTETMEALTHERRTPREMEGSSSPKVPLFQQAFAEGELNCKGHKQESEI
ncbi:hypothetical protein B0H19DRAFT_716636 [Mycena capillaripes]|nr:hypothetical protein B0H19DRAFT_716636 [Mycena capillaripes]